MNYTVKSHHLDKIHFSHPVIFGSFHPFFFSHPLVTDKKTFGYIVQVFSLPSMPVGAAMQDRLMDVSCHL